MSSASCVAINMYVSQCSAGHVVQKILDWRRVLKFVAHPRQEPDLNFLTKLRIVMICILFPFPTRLMCWAKPSFQSREQDALLPFLWRGQPQAGQRKGAGWRVISAIRRSFMALSMAPKFHRREGWIIGQLTSSRIEANEGVRTFEAVGGASGVFCSERSERSS